MRFNEPYPKTRFKEFKDLILFSKNLTDRYTMGDLKYLLNASLQDMFKAFVYELDLNEKQRHYIGKLKKQISQHNQAKKSKKKANEIYKKFFK